MRRSTSLTRHELALLKTVCYSAVFEYPMTLDELSKGLLECELDRDSIQSLYRSSQSLQRILEYKAGYFFLRGQDHLLGLRQRRRRFSLRLLEQHRWILRLICLIPFTRLVALSGGSAHLNLEPKDDIDLFLVTSGRRVWSVAVVTLILLRLFRKRRLVCFNYLLSDQHLRVDRDDLFSANQMIHLQPLIGRETAAQLLRQNPFVFRIYPNFNGLQPAVLSCGLGKTLTGCKFVLEGLLKLGASQLGEWICHKAYGTYLRRQSHRWSTPEEVILNRDVLKLHSFGHRKQVLSQFNRQLEHALRSLAGEADPSPAIEDQRTGK